MVVIRGCDFHRQSVGTLTRLIVFYIYGFSPGCVCVVQVLVVEFWAGCACRCPHRCEEPTAGLCPVTARNAAALDAAAFEDALLSCFDPGFLDGAMEALRDEEEEEKEDGEEKDEGGGGDDEEKGRVCRLRGWGVWVTVEGAGPKSGRSWSVLQKSLQVLFLES